MSLSASVSPSTSSRTRKRMPSASSRPKIAQTFGWWSAASMRASRSKRASRFGSFVKARGRILIATSRPELRVAGPVHLAHPARADERPQLVPAEGPAGHGRRTQVGRHLRRRDERRPGEEPVLGNRFLEQRLHLASERLVVTAGLGEERRALARRPVARRVVQLVDPLPALRRHERHGAHVNPFKFSPLILASQSGGNPHDQPSPCRRYPGQPSGSTRADPWLRRRLSLTVSAIARGLKHPCWSLTTVGNGGLPAGRLKRRRHFLDDHWCRNPARRDGDARWRHRARKARSAIPIRHHHVPREPGTPGGYRGRGRDEPGRQVQHADARGTHTRHPSPLISTDDGPALAMPARTFPSRSRSRTTCSPASRAIRMQP